MKNIDKQVDAQRFPAMENALWEWVHLLDLYIREWRGAHFPWWFNEEASVSTLAGALWKTGGLVLEEFYTVRKPHIVGRCDLYFRLCGEEFSAEAKQAWPDADWPKSALQSDVNWYFREAVKQVKSYAPSMTMHAGRRVVMVFVTPYIKKLCAAQMEEQTDSFIDHMKTMDYAAIAWNFPSFIRENKLMAFVPKDEFYYPGVALLIREITIV